MNINKSYNMLLSPVSTKTSNGESDSFELKLLLHYLFKHLLLLGRGSLNDFGRSDSEGHDHKILRQSPNFQFLCPHIINCIQKILRSQGPPED